MTPANVTKVEALARHFASLAKENPDANASMFAMLNAIAIIQGIMTDLHFRPEVNC